METITLNVKPQTLTLNPKPQKGTAMETIGRVVGVGPSEFGSEPRVKRFRLRAFRV